MRKRLNQLLVFLIILPLFMMFQCTKPPFFIEYEYDFVEKLDLFPAQKTYHVGDTVWVQYVNTDTKFLDTKTNQRIQADTLSVLFLITLKPLYNTIEDPAGGWCDFITPARLNTGTFLPKYGTDLLKEVGCEPPNVYDFKIGIVFKEKGIFTLELSPNSTVMRCNNRVNDFPISSMQFEFNLVDGNKDVFLSVPLASRGGKSESKATEKKIDERITIALKVE